MNDMFYWEYGREEPAGSKADMIIKEEGLRIDEEEKGRRIQLGGGVVTTNRVNY